MKKYNTLAIVGTFWGDEGKGKFIDFFSHKADIVVRSQGGSNAGHTIKFDDNSFVLTTLPSGIFNSNTTCLITNGVVLNPEILIKEIELVENNNFKIKGRLKISPKAHIVLPMHKEIDQFWESLKENKIGTTKQGIGPAYADKVLRMGIRVNEFIDQKLFAKKLKFLIEIYQKILKAFDFPIGDGFNYEKTLKEYQNLAIKIKPYVIEELNIELTKEIENDKKVMFEGAQGILLCLDNGTYPMVTSSSPTASSIPLNAGINPKYIYDVLGITKAYVTRVGEGFFPTFFENDIAKAIREKGHEYGSVTKRPRRIGWIDLVAIKHGKVVSGINYLAITLLDVLTGLDEIKICKNYQLHGKTIDYIPSNFEIYQQVKPIYLSLKGWKEDISQIKKYEDLPKNAKIYIETIEKLAEIEVALISVGPNRDQTIIKKEIF